MNESLETELRELTAAIHDQTRAIDALAASNDRVVLTLLEQSDESESPQQTDLAGRPL
ncbi:hypothetical protein [Kushneria phosphatilytica]|uniref:hypothetical protein n=1 Tax=Kushneria phosphatilytica TaxID=657387 RepID=UPI00143C39D2|nr:hypothetical protein [Kushneria phosphatilytica]